MFCFGASGHTSMASDLTGAKNSLRREPESGKVVEYHEEQIGDCVHKVEERSGYRKI